MRIKFFGHVFYIPLWVKVATIVLLFIILGCIGFNIRKNKSIIANNPDLLSSTATPQLAQSTVVPTPIQTSPPKITVYIIGCVANPSVVEIPVGSIIQDAVDAAGGLTEEADPTKINMAYPLADNMMIKIPSVNDTATSIDNDLEDFIATAKPPEESFPVTENNLDGKININTADIKTLCNLPGIGESTAQKIIDFRTQNGSFEHIEDIMNVPGIKQSRYDSIKDMITVG